MEVWKGPMSSVGTGRPTIRFMADKTLPKVFVHASTQSQSGAEGPPFDLPVMEDTVDEYVLKFFRRLASEPRR